ncbi:Fungal Zn2-Cys6 binuclear cluster domain-containing protein [Cladophialophora immunda]|nr:Fungal Zn2-Cys6 binuclear cluster domain-containing protein [Cladophialophora immunda]
MSTRAGEQPKSTRRKYVSTACTTCRDGKIRCDGVHPICGNCKKKKKQCVYAQGEDKRRIPVRKAIQVFSARLSELEQFIRTHGLEPPPLNANDAALIDRLIETLQQPGTSPKEQVALETLEPEASAQGEGLTNDLIPLPISGSQEPQRRHSQPGEYQNNVSLRGPEEFMLDLAQMNSNRTIPAHAPEVGDLFTNYTDMDDQLAALQESNIAFPEWTTDFTGLNAMPLGMTYGWIDLQIPYPDMEMSGTDQSLGPATSPESISATDLDLRVAPDDEGSDGVINEIAERMGTLQVTDDGELRYFGATSNLPLRDDTGPTTQSAEANVARSRGQRLLDAAGLGQHVDEALEDHLTNLYFTWQDPTFHVVDRELYRQARRTHRSRPGRSSYLSETLINAICAFGAIYDTGRHENFPLPLPKFFAKRAKIWLDIELDSPRVATVQALVILSSFEAASTNDARGWLYSGMSVRLSFDLGLHLDMTPYVAKGLMSSTEAEARKMAFWGSFVVDHLWGFYLGRPPCRISNHNPSVHQPADRIPGLQRWVPYGVLETLPEATLSVPDSSDPNGMLPRQWVLLCEAMDDVSHVLYERADVSDKMLQSLADETVSKLDQWRRNLPLALQVSLDKHDGNIKHLPHVLVLHMQYHQFMIYIHRPFMSKTASSTINSNIRHMHARSVCIESAVAISVLLRIYKSSYPLRFVNVEVVSIVFSAAIILVLASVLDLEGTDKLNLQRHLDTCCRALAELGKAFKNASRTLDILLDIKRKWQAKLVASEKPKRRALEAQESVRPGTKRRKSQFQPLQG